MVLIFLQVSHPDIEPGYERWRDYLRSTRFGLVYIIIVIIKVEESSNQNVDVNLSDDLK
jgi:hypothetical protein